MHHPSSRPVSKAQTCPPSEKNKQRNRKGLVTIYREGGGGLQNGRGGACEVLPLRKGGRGAEQVLAMLKGGTKSVGVA